MTIDDVQLGQRVRLPSAICSDNPSGMIVEVGYGAVKIVWDDQPTYSIISFEYIDSLEVI